MENQQLLTCIEEASSVVGITWPLYSFVTSNPLSGYEKSSFKEASFKAYQQTGFVLYPEVSFFENAIKKQYISKDTIEKIIEKHGFTEGMDAFFEAVQVLKQSTQASTNPQVDQILVKWLSVFLDEGLADWQMPNKDQGFYAAWRSLAIYDQAITIPANYTLPSSSLAALSELTNTWSEEKKVDVFKNHFSALAGWVGYLKHRKQYQSPWQQAYPVQLEDYLAVRMLISKFLGFPLEALVPEKKNLEQLLSILHECLLRVEDGWQQHFTKYLHTPPSTSTLEDTPAAQLVFCIDTRSELIRRNIENKGNYGTFGYAGFFGIAMDYQAPFSGIVRKSCPPILQSAYVVTEEEKNTSSQKLNTLAETYKKESFKEYFLHRMKNILPSAFGFVEGAGLAYAYQLLKRTFAAPSSLSKPSLPVEHTCQTHIETAPEKASLSLAEEAMIVKSAFDLMGWKVFAPLVVFVGHGSHTANNPFASSLDCGACAASPGRHNARMLALLANKQEVRNFLLKNYQLNIPQTTWFLGAEHNTTTDEILLFDASAPKEFLPAIENLKTDLKKAQKTATQERLGNSNSLHTAYKKSTDWSETRPEWGLAKNAGFVIAPRSLTQHLQLEGQCFLHSYQWQTDLDGSALNAILNGPMVVTQWINNHYYFSTVDNHHYGSGSKITHNIIGKFGVVQGNGGDLKTGLPLQSVKSSDHEYYHAPQRLSVFINAPKNKIDQLLNDNPHLKQLIENQWIHLLVIDPKNDNQVEKYTAGATWLPVLDKLEKSEKTSAY